MNSKEDYKKVDNKNKVGYSDNDSNGWFVSYYGDKNSEWEIKRHVKACALDKKK